MKPQLAMTCLCTAVVWGATVRAADELGSIPPGQFDALHRMIRVHPGEQRFWQIPWKLSIAEARAQAAREGKPLFVWAGAGGVPIGAC